MTSTPGSFPATSVYPIYSPNVSTASPSRPASDRPLPPHTDTQGYLNTQMLSRRKEYIRPKSVKIKVGSWNVAAFEDTEKDLAEWLVDDARDIMGVSADGFEQQRCGDERQDGEEEEGDNAEVGIYVIGLQEVVDLNRTENFLKYLDPKIALSWKAHAQATLPLGYVCVASPQIIGLLLLVFISPRLLPHVSSASVSTVGTGLMGYVGNKGAVGARVVLGETLRLVFVDSHLAAFANNSDRRNWDAAEITRRMVFEPVAKEVIGLGGVEDDQTDVANNNTNPGEGLDKADIIIWCGDLNYRVDLPNEDIRRLLSPYMPKDLPPTHAEGPATPVSPKFQGPRRRQTIPPLPSEVHPDAKPTLEGTIESLLKHDQLYKAQKDGKSLVGYKEGKIGFLPTYKYDLGTVGVWDSSEKSRSPSYCDRILWKLKGAENEDAKSGRRRAISRVSLRSIGGEEVLLETDDPEEEDIVVSRGETVVPATSFSFGLPKPSNRSTLRYPAGEVKLLQLYYTSYQSVTSSDHKPVVALFEISFPSVVLDLRAKVHTEVVREIDKVENERRPVVTVIIDHNDDGDADEGIVDFGRVRFGEDKNRHVTVANTGTSTAKLGFVGGPALDGEGEVISNDWLEVSFSGGTPLKDRKGVELEPGDACNILLEVKINDVEGVRAFNDRKIGIEDVLILRVEKGRDIFLPISGEWLQSSYGRAFGELVTVPEGVGGIRGWKAKGDVEGEVLYSAPRELYKLTEFLLERIAEIVEEDSKDSGPTQEEKDNGWPFVLTDDPPVDTERWDKIKVGVWECIDRDLEFDEDEALRIVMDRDEEEVGKKELVEVMAAVLLEFLQGSKESVIPTSMWNDIMKAGGDKRLGEEVLESLPKKASSVHTNIFIYLTGFISKLIKTLHPPSPLGSLQRMDSIASVKSFSSTSTKSRASGLFSPISATSSAPWRRAAGNGKKRVQDLVAEAVVRAPEGKKVSRVEGEKRRAFWEGFVF